MIQIAVSVLAVCAVLAFQNFLFLETTALITVYELATAAELYASLCLLYFSARFFLLKRFARKPPAPVKIRRLFTLVFSPAILYCSAILFNLPFNLLSHCTSLVMFASWCVSLAFIVAAFSTKDPAAPSPLFSKRENEVVSLILQGKTIQETADALFISVATVKTHLQHIYEKAGVRNRTELALAVSRQNEAAR